MAKVGAPKGNDNAAKGTMFRNAIQRHVAQRPKDLEDAVKALFAKAIEGDVPAIKEIGDRLDGKAKQVVDNEGTLHVVSEIRRVIVDTGNSDS